MDEDLFANVKPASHGRIEMAEFITSTEFVVGFCAGLAAFATFFLLLLIYSMMVVSAAADRHIDV